MSEFDYELFKLKERNLLCPQCNNLMREKSYGSPPVSIKRICLSCDYSYVGIGGYKMTKEELELRDDIVKILESKSMTQIPYTLADLIIELPKIQSLCRDSELWNTFCKIFCTDCPKGSNSDCLGCNRLFDLKKEKK